MRTVPPSGPRRPPGTTAPPDAADLDVSWEGIPLGSAFLHLVRAADHLPATERRGRWAVVVDYQRTSSSERLLPASAFRYDQLPPRAALELGAALFASIPDSASGLEAPTWPRQRPSQTLPTSTTPLSAVSRATPLQDDGSYRAPERTVGAPKDAASATYTGAAIVLDLLVGRPLGLAHTTSADALEEIVDSAVLEAWQQLGDTEAANTTVAMLRAALAPLPDHRPDARMVSEALAAAAAEQPGDDLARFVRRAATAPPVAPAAPATLARPSRPSRPRRPLPVFELLAVAAMATAFAALLAIVIVVMQLRH